MPVLFVEMGMHIRKKNIPYPITNEVNEMKAHLVLTGKLVGAQPNRHAVIGNADQQRSSLSIQKSCDRSEDGEVHLFVRLSSVKISA